MNTTTKVIVPLLVAVIGAIGAIFGGAFQGAGTQTIYGPGTGQTQGGDEAKRPLEPARPLPNANDPPAAPPVSPASPPSPDAPLPATEFTSPPPAPVAASPLATETVSGVQYDVTSAVAEGSTLAITLHVTNKGTDRLLVLRDPIRSNSYGAKLTDEQGNTFRPDDYRVGNQRSRGDIANGVRTPVTLRFSQMPTVAGKLEASMIARLTLNLYTRQGKSSENGEVIFQSLPIQKD